MLRARPRQLSAPSPRFQLLRRVRVRGPNLAAHSIDAAGGGIVGDAAAFERRWLLGLGLSTGTQMLRASAAIPFGTVATRCCEFARALELMERGETGWESVWLLYARCSWPWQPRLRAPLRRRRRKL